MEASLSVAIVNAIVSLAGVAAAAWAAWLANRAKKQSETNTIKVDEIKHVAEATSAQVEGNRQVASQAASDNSVKLDRIKAVVKETQKTGEATHLLVNSSMSAALQVGATALRRVAELTKHPDDRTAADKAERLLQEHNMQQQVVDQKQGAGGTPDLSAHP